MLALEAAGGKPWQDKSNGKRREMLAGKTEEGPAKLGVVKARKEDSQDYLIKRRSWSPQTSSFFKIGPVIML